LMRHVAGGKAIERKAASEKKFLDGSR
jgi:hypothetical protein